MKKLTILSIILTVAGGLGTIVEALISDKVLEDEVNKAVDKKLEELQK